MKQSSIDGIIASHGKEIRPRTVLIYVTQPLVSIPTNVALNQLLTVRDKIINMSKSLFNYVFIMSQNAEVTRIMAVHLR